MVQWLRLHAPIAGGLSSIPGLGTGSHMLPLKILCASAKTRCSQINILKRVGQRELELYEPSPTPHPSLAILTGPAEPPFLQVLDGDCSAYLAGVVRVSDMVVKVKRLRCIALLLRLFGCSMYFIINV